MRRLFALLAALVATAAAIATTPTGTAATACTITACTTGTIAPACTNATAAAYPSAEISAPSYIVPATRQGQGTRRGKTDRNSASQPRSVRAASAASLPARGQLRSG